MASENITKVELGSGTVGIVAMQDENGVFIRFRKLDVQQLVGSPVHVCASDLENKDGDVCVYFGSLRSTMVLVEQLSLVVARHVSLRDNELRASLGCAQVFQVDKDLE